MKRLSTTLMTLIILFVFGLSVNAQFKQTPRQRALVLAKKLNLTDAQEGYVEFIFIQTDEKINKILKKNSGNKEKSGKLLRQTIDESDKQIEKLLSNKQKEEYIKIKEEQREKMEERMHSSNGRK